MARAVKVYPPDERRNVPGNLLCPSCGNTTAFVMDLRLRHSLTMKGEGIETGLDPVPTGKLLKALERNLFRVVDQALLEEKPRISCANCGDNETVDLLERVVDSCWNAGCPGCWYCANFLDEETVRELCTECLISRNGEVEDETCEYGCPHYDFGLGDVRDHYGFSLADLKTELGFSRSKSG